MTAAIFKHAWNLYRTNFGVIAGVILFICLPINLLNSYMDYFVFAPDDFRKSFKFSIFLDDFVGIIANAGIISIGYISCLGQRASFRSAMSMSLSSWGRMWWTRFLTGLAVILGCLLLIVPGIYLLIRLALVEYVVVCESVSGPTAMRRSFELTKGRFWQLFLLGLGFGVILVPFVACFVLPVIFIPELDHWLVDAATSLVADFVLAYGMLCLFFAYMAFSTPILEDSVSLGK